MQFTSDTNYQELPLTLQAKGKSFHKTSPGSDGSHSFRCAQDTHTSTQLAAIWAFPHPLRFDNSLEWN